MDAVPLPTRQRGHLVVELKRPDLVPGATELTPLSQYALAVAGDRRFDKVDVRRIWLVGTEMDEYVAGQARQPVPPLSESRFRPSARGYYRRDGHGSSLRPG